MRDRFRPRVPDPNKDYDLRYKKQLPENKIHLFIKVFEEIKNMGGGAKKHEEERGFSHFVIDRLYSDQFLSVEMGKKILAYHAALKSGKLK